MGKYFPKKLLLGVVMKIKKILLIGICLLVATLGLTAASAAEVNNDTMSEVLGVEHNIESINQDKVESINEGKKQIFQRW